MKNVTKYFVIQLIWSILTGALKYFITSYSTNGIMGMDGHTNDLWNIGALITIIDVTVVHV